MEIAGVPVRAGRITYVGELGWEILVPAAQAAAVFDSIIDAGRPHGLRLAGYHAMNSLRLEKAYRHWGHDITPDETPAEAGLGFCVAWDKPGGFIGREALLPVRGVPPSRRVVQFLLEDPEPLLIHAEPILRDGKVVGRITSGMYGHVLGAAVGLGQVDAGAPTAPDAFLAGRFEIDVAGRRIPARASLKPFYDPKGERVRG